VLLAIPDTALLNRESAGRSIFAVQAQSLHPSRYLFDALRLERLEQLLPGAWILGLSVLSRTGIVEILAKMNRPIADLAFLKIGTVQGMNTGPAQA
jgi:hypothetical protein